MSDSKGQIRVVTTNRGDRFQFTDVVPGETYIFSVQARKYSFIEPVIVKTITEDFSDLNFVSNNSYGM